MTLTADADTFESISRATSTRPRRSCPGRLSVDGDMGLAMKLGQRSRLMDTAPFFADVAEGPEGGAAWWITARDDVRLRVGLWNREAPRGTVLLWPGRTEYIEKYGRAAARLPRAAMPPSPSTGAVRAWPTGCSTTAMSGHVHQFSDYQHDVAAMYRPPNARPAAPLAPAGAFDGRLHRPARGDAGARRRQRRLFRADVGHQDGRRAAPGGVVAGLGQPSGRDRAIATPPAPPPTSTC